ncbi:MAG: hypothetical protein O3B74_10805 [Proteobacteria bacterium]|nr:hypothetical protein [Pseudomonadota bacterium]
MIQPQRRSTRTTVPTITMANAATARYATTDGVAIADAPTTTAHPAAAKPATIRLSFWLTMRVHSQAMQPAIKATRPAKYQPPSTNNVAAGGKMTTDDMMRSARFRGNPKIRPRVDETAELPSRMLRPLSHSGGYAG